MSWPLRLVARDPSAVDGQDGPDPVPFELVGPSPSPVAGSAPAMASIGAKRLGERLVAGRRRIHAMDHPLLALGGEEHVAALGPCCRGARP